MARKIKYYLVAAEALPEIFIRVAEAKRMMQTGEADTVGAATKMAGISRSAFYKYKDAVQPFNDMKSEHIITFYTLLKDVSGTLSSVLGVFAASGANILTINQRSHQRLRGRDYFRRDLCYGEVSGTADHRYFRIGQRYQIRDPGRIREEQR